MNTETIIVILAGVFSVLLTYLLYAGFVRKTSHIYKEIGTLNEASSFLPVQEKYQYTKNCKSKADFDRSNIEHIFIAFISSDISQFKSLVLNLEENRKRFEVYTASFERILTSVSSNDKYGKYPFYRLIEKAKCNSLKVRPPVNVTFSIICRYSSPKGRNQYTKSQNYDYIALVDALYTISQIEKKKATKEFQRSIMSRSLRYDILKRDGFRCVLCGTTASDGSQLHVDHIVPVSKVGKTVKSNLRTLCDDCNLGKRDKYELDGLN